MDGVQISQSLTHQSLISKKSMQIQTHTLCTQTCEREKVLTLTEDEERSRSAQFLSTEPADFGVAGAALSVNQQTVETAALRLDGVDAILG